MRYEILIVGPLYLCSVFLMIHTDDVMSIFCHHRYPMGQSKLTGAILLPILLGLTITLNGQLEQARENLTFWNLKMLA